MSKSLLFKIELLTLFLSLVFISSIIIYYKTDVTFTQAIWTATLAAIAKTIVVHFHRALFARWHQKNGEKQEIDPDDVIG